MSILIDHQSSVLIQGITGRQGSLHTRLMMDYGTRVVGGITPGKGGDWIEGIPVFDTVHRAVDATGATISLIMVPAVSAPDAIIEAADAGINLIVCITEGLPVQAMMRVYRHLRGKKVRLIGPNSPGILNPGQAKVGIIPAMCAIPGQTGVVSRSGTLMYEICYAMTLQEIGQSTIIGTGGDAIKGTSMVDILEMFETDLDTDKVVLIGEIGGLEELEAADYIQNEMTKPVIAFIAGTSAPQGKRMGHAGAVIEEIRHTAQHKKDALESAGAHVATTLEDVIDLLKV